MSIIRGPAVLVAMLAVSACAHGQRQAGVPAGARYVALGSSFAAGPLLGPTKPDTPRRCGRTAASYASRLADALRLRLVDATCSGATTAHVLGNWNELPPQIDAVTPDTRLVTITIGGNDVGYVSRLGGASCRAGAPEGGRPCPPATLPSENDYRVLAGNLRAVAHAVKARAPAARILFVQYVTLVPEAPCPAAWLVPGEIDGLRRIGRRLAATTARVARETGVAVFPADTLSRDHTPCSPAPWSNGAYPGYDPARGPGWHPNASGMSAIADRLRTFVVR